MSLNVVALMGRLTVTPELKHTPNNVSVCSFTIAVDRSYVKAGEERQADFIPIVCWRGQADFACRYFQKGQLIALDGKIQTRKYTDRDGNKRTAFEVVADNVHFAESKKDGNKNTYERGPADVEPERGDTGDFEEMPVPDDLPF